VQIPEARVSTRRAHELVVRTELDHVPAIENGDAVGIACRQQVV
jgi:hypothetical protein